MIKDISHTLSNYTRNVGTSFYNCKDKDSVLGRSIRIQKPFKSTFATKEILQTWNDSLSKWTHGTALYSIENEKAPIFFGYGRDLFCNDTFVVAYKDNRSIITVVRLPNEKRLSKRKHELRVKIFLKQCRDGKE